MNATGETQMTKAHPPNLNTRWHLAELNGVHGRPERYSASRKLERTRWERNRRNKWKLVSENVTELTYCAEGRAEPEGFRKGARVHLASRPDNNRLDALAHNAQMRREAAQQKFHWRERLGVLFARG